MPRRRLVSAQLTDREDADLLPWIDQLVADGLLSHAVREGLRIVKLLSATPGAKDLWRRGILARALEAAIFTLPAVHTEPPVAPAFPSIPPEVPSPPASPAPRETAALDDNLDSLLQNL